MSSVPRSLSLPLDRDAVSAVGAAVRTAARTFRVASFWIAIVLPVTYLPLLAGGLGGGQSLLFAALVAVNAGAFVLGHEYDPADAE